ncbi:MAG: hypothetical protein KAT47_05165 [Candidatus Aegiribacteria sp.]|nr:hypothetical protein [Candidatus Aegiribacteria sp.]
MVILRFVIQTIIRYSYYAFILFAIVTALPSGFTDTVYYGRYVKAQNERILEAESSEEEYVPVDYVPNLITGIAAFLMFIGASALAVMFMMKRVTGITHIILIVTAALSALIFLLPRPPIGTGTESMKEVFAFLTLLGIIDIIFFRSHAPLISGRPAEQAY